MEKQSVLCVVGTRPEAIKMAPLILRLRKEPDRFETTVMATAQHRQLLDQVMDVFGIVPDIDLDIMQANQTLTQVTCRVLTEMTTYLEQHQPDIVLAQGDTTTVMAASMACFYTRHRFGHVEAGLRTGQLHSPFPEEFNRKVAGVLSEWHFAPTPPAADNLLREGTRADSVFVTGNSVIDALLYTLGNTTPPPSPVPEGAPYILMTCHRRENFGAPVREIFTTIRDLARARPELTIWYPVHPNPNVLAPAREILGGAPNILLTEPLDYTAFVHAMAGARLCLSDSGGVQEEAPSLGKPVLVLRDNTERPEGVDAGTCRLVGTNRDVIEANLNELLDDEDAYQRVALTRNPYGDGHTADRITDLLAGRSYTPWDPNS